MSIPYEDFWTPGVERIGTPTCEQADESEAEEPSVWRVAFGENFWGKCTDAEAGKEFPIGRCFRWADRDWLIPAVYLCEHGLVVDLCMSVEAEQERAFVEKCAALFSRELSDEESEQCEAQNPLEIVTTIDARVNGMVMKTVCGCTVDYLPESCHPDGFLPNDPVALRCVEHYDLDPSLAWRIERVSYAWASAPVSTLDSVVLTLNRWPVPVPGGHFTVSEPGQQFRIVDPLTGDRYTLTVEEYEAQTLEGNAFAGDGLIAPTHLHLMSYTLSPDLSNDVFLLSDCERSDPPRQTGETGPLTAAVSVAATVGIIGGADGPTALYVSTPQKNLHTAVSSLHFAPRGETEWRVTFRKRESEPITLELID